jgi:hypothetical protein
MHRSVIADSLDVFIKGTPTPIQRRGQECAELHLHSPHTTWFLIKDSENLIFC